MADDFKRQVSEAEALPGETRERLGAFMASRAKTWDELTPDERIERLRERLRSKDMAIQDLQQALSALMSHRHGQNGELLGRIYFGQPAMSAGNGYYDPLA